MAAIYEQTSQNQQALRMADKALTILRQLKQQSRLPADKEAMIPELEKLRQSLN